MGNKWDRDLVAGLGGRAVLGLAGALLVGFAVAPLATAAVQQPVKLTILWRDNALEVETLTQALKAFEQANPGISVELVVSAGGSAGEDKLKVMYAAGDPPDIFASLFVAGFMDYVYKDMLLDLTPFIQQERYRLDDFLPGSPDTFRVGGKYYGLPRGGVGSFGFYNAELFDQAGLPYPPASWEDPSWTWDHVANIGKKLTKRTADGRFEQVAVQLGFGPLGNFAPLMWGTSMFGPELYQFGIGTELRATDPAVVESYQRILDLRFADEVAPASIPQGGILSGKVAMYFGIGNLPMMRQAQFKWSIMPLPRGRADIQQRSTTFTGPLLIAKSTKHPQEAWRLLKFLVGPEGQRYIAPGAVIGTSRLSLLRWHAQLFPSIPLTTYAEVTQGAYRHGLESFNVRLVEAARIIQMMNAAEAAMWSRQKSARQALEELAQSLRPVLAEVTNSNAARRAELFGAR